MPTSARKTATTAEFRVDVGIAPTAICALFSCCAVFQPMYGTLYKVRYREGVISYFFLKVEMKQLRL